MTSAIVENIKNGIMRECLTQYEKLELIAFLSGAECGTVAKPNHIVSVTVTHDGYYVTLADGTKDLIQSITAGYLNETVRVEVKQTSNPMEVTKVMERLMDRKYELYLASSGELVFKKQVSNCNG
jgi:hypothetical protein